MCTSSKNGIHRRFSASAYYKIMNLLFLLLVFYGRLRSISVYVTAVVHHIFRSCFSPIIYLLMSLYTLIYTIFMCYLFISFVNNPSNFRPKKTVEGAWKIHSSKEIQNFTAFYRETETKKLTVCCDCAFSVDWIYGDGNTMNFTNKRLKINIWSLFISTRTDKPFVFLSIYIPIFFMWFMDMKKPPTFGVLIESTVFQLPT